MLVTAGGQDVSSAAVSVTALGMTPTTDTQHLTGAADPATSSGLQPVQSAGDANPGNVFRLQGGRQPFYMYNLQTSSSWAAGMYRLYFQITGDPLLHWVAFTLG
jgi:hypothetical protein